MMTILQVLCCHLSFKFCVATCTRREVATLLWTLSRRRRAFLGPGNTFYLFVLLIFETWKYFFGTWKYFLSFLSSHFWDLDIRFNVFFLLRRKTFSKCTPLGTLHLFMGKYCLAFHFEGGRDAKMVLTEKDRHPDKHPLGRGTSICKINRSWTLKGTINTVFVWSKDLCRKHRLSTGPNCKS